MRGCASGLQHGGIPPSARRHGAQPDMCGGVPQRRHLALPAPLRRHARVTCAAETDAKAWRIGTVLIDDSIKEDSRKYERMLSTFTFDRWASHRSTARYIRHMRDILSSSIVRALLQPLASVGSIAILTCIYEDLRYDGTLPDFFPSFLMPTAPFDLTSFALALLLVFRTNTSYDRWLETCVVWSGLANRSRDTMRQLISHLGDESGAISPLAAAMCRWVVAYIRSLKAELVEGVNLEEELQGVLTQPELLELLNAHHRPSFALSVLTELGAAAPLRESHRIRLDENLTWFEDAVGTCERILRTPIPLSYTRHTSRFMVIWLSALPLGLYESCGFATVPLSMTIAFLLLGIDEIGVQIEEPFGLLPLEELCVEVEGDLYSMLQEAVATKRTASQAAAAAMGVGVMGAASPLPRASKRSPTSVGPQTGHTEWAEMRGRVASNRVALRSDTFDEVVVLPRASMTGTQGGSGGAK